MLNGVAPVVIFNFPTIPTSVENIIKGIPAVGNLLASNVGLPIPIYLDEQLTGIAIESETRGIEIQTTAQGRNDGQSPQVDQRTLDNVVTVNLVASNNNIILTSLLALCDMVFTRVVSKNYGLSYLSGSVVVLGGLLRTFNTTASNNDNLVHVTLEISKSNTAPVDLRVNNPIALPASPGGLPPVR